MSNHGAEEITDINGLRIALNAVMEERQERGLERGDPLDLPDVNFHRCSKKNKDKTKKVLAWIGARTIDNHHKRDKIDFLN